MITAVGFGFAMQVVRYLALGIGGLGFGPGPDDPVRTPENGTPIVLDGEFEVIRAAQDVPGMAALAYWRGKVVAYGRAGVRSVASGESIQIDDPFHLGSCGKAMTSTVIAKAIEAGDLEWATTVADGLPELAEEIHPGYRDVTVEQLLRHRGGIAERTNAEVGAIFLQFEALAGTPREQRWEIARRVLSRPPTREPGASTEYSNYGYMIAAAILENLIDRPWSEIVQTELFDAMELQSAHYGSPCGDHVPVGHRRESEEEEWIALSPGPAGFLPDCMGPAGLEHMSLTDWARFVRSHIAGVNGKDGLLEADTYRRLHEEQNGSAYACGWGSTERSWGQGEVWTHNGSDNTWYSVVWAAPKLDLVLVAGANCGTANSACDAMAATLLEALELD